MSIITVHHIEQNFINLYIFLSVSLCFFMFLLSRQEGLHLRIGLRSFGAGIVNLMALVGAINS